MKINERWEELKEETNENIQSEEGILKRQTRSIQTEGHFGDIKENENFRRFHYRSKEKVYKELLLQENRSGQIRADGLLPVPGQIGRASCRERVYLCV